MTLARSGGKMILGAIPIVSQFARFSDTEGNSSDDQFG
jgi:hypothetical protein